MKRIVFVLILNIPLIICYGQQRTNLDDLIHKLTIEKSDTGKITLCYRIAYELQFSDPDESMKYANKALQDSREINYEKGIGNSLIQLGNIEQVKGNNTKSEEYNLEALKILTRINDKTGIAICYNNLGILAHNSNDYSKAIDYYGKALLINREIHRQSGEANSLYCIGTVFENQAQYDSALTYYLNALKISESITDTKLIAYGKISLANVYFLMENWAKSLEYNEEAIALYEKSGNKWGLLKVYMSLGQTAERLDSTSLAIWFYRQVMQISSELDSPNDKAGAYFSTAHLFEDKGIIDSAGTCFNKALSLYRITGNMENTALSLIALARINNYRNNYQNALEQLNEAIKISNEIQSPSGLTEGYREMAIIYSGLKDFRKAFKYLNKYSDTRDSLMTVEKQRQILELQTAYETDKKEKENEILRKDQQILQTTRNSLIIGALLLFIIALTIYNSLRLKKRDNKLLKQQKEEIERQKEIVELQKKSITDSIIYARRIQSAMLPPPDLVEHTLKNSFILYLPRDIVSGDFYWIRELQENVIMTCVADCTGHGVPGAFMSMLGMSLINEIVNHNLKKIISNEYTTSDILNELRNRIKTSLRQTGKEGEARDGMDLSLCIIDRINGELRYSGANNSIYIVNDNSFNELKATRNPIGIYLNEVSFSGYETELLPGSTVYMFSDGYSDQLGPNGKKFLSKNFKNLLSTISDLPAEEIKEKLYKAHTEWKKDEEQVDDILVVGIKI